MFIETTNRNNNKEYFNVKKVVAITEIKYGCIIYFDYNYQMECSDSFETIKQKLLMHRFFKE